jgi:tetratricopeptide (TPR) repeat protein
MDLPPVTDPSIRHYEERLAKEPKNAGGHFNLALLYKRALRYSDALRCYKESIALGIDHVEEVYSNLGVLYSEMRQGEQAREMYERALAVDADYIPALFNLAGLYEESGERAQAEELFRQILDLEPRHWDSLSRLAYAKRFESGNDPLIRSLRQGVATTRDDPAAHEMLCYALGKALDDVGDYAGAFETYDAANAISRRQHLSYESNATEASFNAMTRVFDSDWLAQAQTNCDATPIFICGMYRSGSTLTEQILSAHPSVTAGGELDFLPFLLTQWLQPFPQRLEHASAEDLDPIAREYDARIRELFPGAAYVTDKRPDNFLQIGVIRALFPGAKILYTTRSRADNCLSVYFQQLGPQLRYATDLDAAAHYYDQQERLMTHWTGIAGDDIHCVDYDRLVHEPEPEIRALLGFLGLPWNEACLAFHRSRSLVKTASVWQVRERLHTRSSGRWNNYRRFVDPSAALHGQDQ